MPRYSCGTGSDISIIIRDASGFKRNAGGNENKNIYRGYHMRFLIQRVSEAKVTVDNEVIGEIGDGFCVLIGIAETDTPEIADVLIKKMTGLRIFQDENDKTNLNIDTVGGNLLLISQFTLYADCRKGNRPSFVKAGSPEHANRLYEYIIKRCSEHFPNVQCGSFGAYMKISLVNDGPFTVMLDSDELVKPKASANK